MSWYVLRELPPAVLEKFKAQQRDAPDCGCGCLISKNGVSEVWFCSYHSGLYDAVSEMEEQ